ncbi:hypothetical protein GCM10007199_18410 [Fictibacillus barbaricus]|nr:hypothetical protein GCM10007199_18410 [Fictibacillus barbaricus]
MLKPDGEMLMVKRLPFPEITDLPFFLFSYRNDDQKLSFHRDLFKMDIKIQLYCYKNSY